ncbi:response regulator transcription factor [Streptomyces sp. NBC_01803]|uniref:response regulator transcription factor n=1 Tax=Streptomyces sp. NBC_01803 TaxID=2975946 RepID=UPI002DD7F53C|nr:response regulator transcription factor [Streptomyces sp. NBC_01803]WSA46156.1 response regulator transcription factor [Streptomyces sp. NBC_01803]
MAAVSTAEAPLRLLVVDDHPVVAGGVQLLLRPDPTIVIAGTARSGREAVRVAAEVAPDLVLLDLRLPDMLGTEAIGALRARVPGVRIVLFTAYAEHAALPAALAGGADGCLLKDSSITDLAAALHRIASGVRVIDPRLGTDAASRVTEALIRTGLTPREYEVLRWVAVGRTNPEIAEQLGLTRNTVKAYLQSAMAKLGAHNRVEAVARAGQERLL